MSHSDVMNRRDALKLCLSAGAGVALTAGSVLSGGAAAGVPPRAAELLMKPIPSSGEQIPLIGIGTARRYDVAESEAELAPLREVIREFPRLGGQLIDTAPSYGRAETVVGNLVAEHGNRDGLFIATKVRRSSDGLEAGLAEIEESFQRLQTDHFELLQVHNLAGVDHMLPVLRDMKEEGRIRYYGITTSFEGQYADFVSVMEREEMDFIQVDYAIDNRSAEEKILPLAADRGIAVLTNLPFGRGRVFQAFGDQPIPEWAAEFGIETWAQFALKWVVSHPAVTCAIPGTARPEYLTDNMGAARGSLPDEATRARMEALIDDA